MKWLYLAQVKKYERLTAARIHNQVDAIRGYGTSTQSKLLPLPLHVKFCCSSTQGSHCQKYTAARQFIALTLHPPQTALNDQLFAIYGIS